ncbi:Uncharacterised protein [uncultured archaeon]|nr:Uncharacterised protein [uncultured archaeon]
MLRYYLSFMVVGELAYKVVLGQPVIVWGGIATLLMVCLTFSIGYFYTRGIRWIPFKHHKHVAKIALALAFLHALLAMGANLGF